MDLAILTALTNREFDTLMTDDEGNILFAAPIPGASGLDYEIRDGRVHPLGSMEDWQRAWDEYISQLEISTGQLTTSYEEGPENRSRKKAVEAGAKPLPKKLAIPTARFYSNSLTMNKTEKAEAYLRLVPKNLSCTMGFDDDKLTYNSSIDAANIDLEEYYIKNPKAASKIDLPKLFILYSIIHHEVADMLKGMNPGEILKKFNDPQYIGYSATIYIPDLLAMMGYKRNHSKDMIDSTINTIKSYSQLTGVLKVYEAGKIYYNKYAAMVWMGYDDKTCTLRFSSPYFNMLIKYIYQKSFQKDGRGNIKQKSDGTPFMLPNHSYLIKPSIVKERNRNAVEIVCIIVTLIEQTGTGTGSPPHISAQTIVDRCPNLKNAIKSASAPDKNKYLKRAFKRAWELLRTQTYIEDVYKNIRIPERIPTASTLDMVFEFPHEGKTTKKP